MSIDRSIYVAQAQEHLMGLERVTLLAVYRNMKAIREFEERVRIEFLASNIPGFVHTYVGEEAIAAGVCAHLTDSDAICSTHRGHGHCIAKGCAIDGMMKEIFCRAGGLCKGKGGSMHIADITKGMLGANAIVGGSAPLANGAALSARTLGTDKVSVAFIGDGASNQGTVFESLNLAAVLKLPTIFVFENNGYAEMTGVNYHCGSGDIARRAGAFGMPSVKVDGTDFFAVYGAMREAVRRARSGEGPSALECIAHRWYGHYEGDPQVYRAKEEGAKLRETSDPLVNFRRRVVEGHALKATEMDEIDRAVMNEIDAAVAAAKSSAVPPPSALLTDVYATY